MSEPPRRPAPAFQPRFTLGLLYLIAFLLLYALLLVAPELAEVAEPGGPENREALEQAAFEAARGVVLPRLPLALAASFLTLYLGGRLGFLPGLRSR